MNILCVGDIFGRPGRKALADLLPGIISRNSIDFVIVNVENAAGGRGLTPNVADELLQLPINVMTAGNHIWQNKSINHYLDKHTNLLRPHNCPSGRPGKGVWKGKVNGLNIAVINLQGRIFMFEEKESTNPFFVIDDMIKALPPDTHIIIVDFHAEATSEKKALAYYCDGRVTAMLGTHTHVQTADEQILPLGTAYISDLGMTGPHDSVIGLEKEIAIKRFMNPEAKGFKVAEGGVKLEGVIIEVDDNTGKALKIKRIQEPL